MKRSVLAAAVTVALATSACGTDADATADTDGLTVVTSLYPLEFLIERIGGDAVTVDNIVPPGQDPHDLELSLQKVAELSEADLAVYLGGFQPAVDEAIETNGPERSLDVHDDADLLSTEDDDHAEDDHAEDDHAEDDHAEDDHAEDDHAEDDHAEEGHDDHDHGGEDPHFWLDPSRMADVAAAIESELAAADPDNAEAFAANLETLTGELTELDTAYESGLADCALDTVVVSHDAFGYLSRYGLEFYGISGLSPDAEPSLAKIGELTELSQDEGITTVFYERLVSSELSDALAERLDLETAVLDTIEGLSDETADEDYLSLMESNLAALQAANDCG